jgi:hypothetical protein
MLNGGNEWAHPRKRMAGGKGIKKGSPSDVYACSVQSWLVLNVYSIAGHPLKRIAEGIKDPPSESIFWLEAGHPLKRIAEGIKDPPSGSIFGLRQHGWMTLRRSFR